MNYLPVVFSLVAIALARSSASIFEPSIYSAVVPIASQFHSQDSLGQYSYAYSGGPSAKSESKTLDGLTRGTYSYVDGDGILQTVHYSADALNGFRAAATNLPKAPIDDKTAPEPVQETPEVAKARAEHLAAFEEAAIRAAKYPDESGAADTEEAEANGNGGAENGSGNGNGKTNGNGNGKTNGNGNSANGHGTTPADTSETQTITLSGFPFSSYGYRLTNHPLHTLNVASLPAIYSPSLATSYAYTTPLLARTPALAAASAGIVTGRLLEHH